MKRYTRLRQKTPLKRTGFKRRKHFINKSSLKYDMIEQTLHYIREIRKMESGYKCEICGRHQDQLPFPLSSFHILRRQTYPRLVLYKPNILVACWATYQGGNFCHNVWHDSDAHEPRHKAIVKKIELRVGLDLPAYIERLKIAEISMPKLSLFNIDNQRFIYKHEYDRLKREEGK